MYGPQIITDMVLKYKEMSSSDQIPIHENGSLSLKVVRFSNGYISWVMKMCTVITPFGSFCSASFVYAFAVSCA